MRSCPVEFLTILPCLLVAPSTPAVAAEPAPTPKLAAPKLAEVSVAASPGSVCRIDPRAIPPGGKSPVIPTDRTGHAHFYVSADATKTGGPIHLALVCDDANAKSTSVTAHIVPTDFAVRKPATAKVAAPPVATSHVGALSAEKIDVTTATDGELERLGYPVRPDADKSPRAYAAWLYIVTTPGLLTKAAPIRIPARHGMPTRLEPMGIVVKPAVGPPVGTYANAIWSGYNLTSTPGFTNVNAFWQVPTVIPAGTLGTKEASTWVGIDGAGEPDVIQAGTDSNSVTELCSQGNGPFDFPFPCNVSVYFAWYEYFPDDVQALNTIVARPGDSFQVLVSATTRGNVVTGHFTIWNMTAHEVQTFTEDTPGGVTSRLDQVEWVVERPTENGDVEPLADTTPVTMADAAFLRNGAPETMFNAPTQTLQINQLIMTVGGTKTVTPATLVANATAGPNTGEIVFHWYRSQ